MKSQLEEIDIEPVQCKVRILPQIFESPNGEGGTEITFSISFVHPLRNKSISMYGNDGFGTLVRILLNCAKGSMVDAELTYCKSSPEKWYITIHEPIDFTKIKITKI